MLSHAELTSEELKKAKMVRSFLADAGILDKCLLLNLNLLEVYRFLKLYHRVGYLDFLNPDLPLQNLMIINRALF